VTAVRRLEKAGMRVLAKGAESDSRWRRAWRTVGAVAVAAVAAVSGMERWSWHVACPSCCWGVAIEGRAILCLPLGLGLKAQNARASDWPFETKCVTQDDLGAGEALVFLKHLAALDLVRDATGSA